MIEKKVVRNYSNLIILNLLVVFLALVLLLGCSLELYVPWPDLLEGVELLGHLLDPSTVDKLVDVEAGSAVWTL